MVVKEKVGRPRHVAFEVDAREPVSRRDVTGALRAVVAARLGREASDAARLQLTVFDGLAGSVRVLHAHREDVVAALAAIRWIGAKEHAARVRVLGVSGTLRGAKRILARRRAPIPEPGPGAD